MNRSEKSERDSESVSMRRFPVSPNFFYRQTTVRVEENIENMGSRSPLIGQQRLNKPLGFQRFVSPGAGENARVELGDFMPLLSHQFDMPLENNQELGRPPFSFLTGGQPPFSPLLTIPAFASPKPRSEPCQIVTRSKMVFNPLKTANSPVDRNFIMQDSIGAKGSGLRKILSFSLRRFNSLYNLPKYPSEETAEGKLPLHMYLARSKKGIRKLSRREAPTKAELPTFEEPTKKRGNRCNCKNSECLKDYCECFRGSRFCGAQCKCRRCKNIALEGGPLRVKPRVHPTAFVRTLVVPAERGHKVVLKRENAPGPAPKAAPGSAKCNCKKSMCVKKYCECFSNGAFCTSNCNCVDCSNSHKNE